MRNLNLRFLLTIEQNAASSYGIKQKKGSNDVGTTMFNKDVCFPWTYMYEVLYNHSLYSGHVIGGSNFEKCMKFYNNLG